MSRRRYLSTDVSVDRAVNRLAREHGDFAALLYTWMIPHAEDTAEIHGDIEEIIAKVIPMRRDIDEAQVEAALIAMSSLSLLKWDRNNQTIRFPAASFYKYQSYIPEAKRKTATEEHSETPSAEECRKTPKDTDEERQTAENPASPSPSPSPSKTIAPPGRIALEESFEEFWRKYRTEARGEDKQSAKAEWMKLKPDRELFNTIMAALERQIAFHQAPRGPDEFIPDWVYACRWLKRRRWEDEVPIVAAKNGSTLKDVFEANPAMAAGVEKLRARAQK
jgi:hypothetical protein